MPDRIDAADERLLAAVAARAADGIPALSTAFARELAAVAYLVVQHTQEANLAAADALAALWRDADDLPDGFDRGELRRRLLVEAARAALARHGRTRTVDAGVDRSWSVLVRGHGPRTRAVAALRAAGLDDGAIGAGLGLDPARVVRMGASISSGAFATALGELQVSLPIHADAALVHQALAAPPRRQWRAMPPAVGAGLAAAVVLGIWLVGQLSPVQPQQAPIAAASASSPAAADAGDAPGPGIASGETPPHDGVGVFTLAECGLSAADVAIVFSGWLAPGEIGADGLAPAGTALYVLVPDEPGAPACVHDPAAGTFAAVRLPPSWQAPVLGDGCAASPFGRFAGYVEVGGPGAFLVLDRSQGWRANDPDLSFLVRVVPPPPSGSALAAWLVPLHGGDRVQVAVDSPPPVDSGRSNVTHYVRVHEANLPSPGCWALNIAIGGAVVGGAVIPVSEALTARP